MTPLLLAFALFAQGAAPAAAPAAPDRLPAGAPADDYQFVAWCYGALRGYLEMHDEVMPEVTRIETQFRRPGSNLADDMKVYADMRADGRSKLTQFQAALTAAEKASLRPINVVGAQAVQLGRAVWTVHASNTTKAAKAQAWMSWTLPARCETVAKDLEARSALMGSAFRADAPK